MGVLKDYSGKFNPNIDFKDFSKEALTRLLNAYARLMLLVDAHWYKVMEEKLGEEEAMRCELPVWMRMAYEETSHISKALNITGRDVESYFKIQQFIPGAAKEYYKLN